jgi:hypothetical protein
MFSVASRADSERRGRLRTSTDCPRSFTAVRRDVLRPMHSEAVRIPFHLDAGVIAHQVGTGFSLLQERSLSGALFTTVKQL